MEKIKIQAPSTNVRNSKHQVPNSKQTKIRLEFVFLSLCSGLSFRKVLGFGILFLVLLPLATATGISPAKTTLISEETKDLVSQFWVVNNEHREVSVSIGVEGQMEQYITLHTTALHLREDDDALPVNFEIHLPAEIPPGQSTASIMVEETIGSLEGNVISSKILLRHKVIIIGPYPDKYVETKLNFHDQGNTISFVSEVTNLGKLEVGEVQTTFYVNDKQQKQHTLETEKTSLASKENKLLHASVDRNLFQQGEFEVSAVTLYDDQKVELSKTLIVGEPRVEITYFDPYFTAYQINKYTLDLLNKWNKQLKNVFVEVEIKKDDQKVDQFRTKSVDIEGEMMKRIEDYLNAKEKGPGRYTFEMAVNFWNLVRQEQKKFVFTAELVEEKEAEELAKSQPLVAAATGEVLKESPAGESSPLSTVFVLALGMLLGMVCFYVGWRYKHRHQYEEGDTAF